MKGKDLDKETLYLGVKALLESEERHIHLCQQKLFTLFSIGFQYLLYASTKNPGYYILRIEDSHLADKLARKAKDDTTRKFIQKLILPRRLRYGDSSFFLDYFNLSTWAQTNDLDKSKVKGALIVKDTTIKPMLEAPEVNDDGTPSSLLEPSLPAYYYLESLKEFSPRTITIAYEANIEGVAPLRFPFIRNEEERLLRGVVVKDRVDLNSDE